MRISEAPGPASFPDNDQRVKKEVSASSIYKNEHTITPYLPPKILSEIFI